MVLVREKHTLLWPAVPSGAAEIGAGGNHDLFGQNGVGRGPFSTRPQPTSDQHALVDRQAIDGNH